MKASAKKTQEAKTETVLNTQESQAAPQVDLALRSRNRALSVDQLLEMLRNEKPELYSLAEVVGSWVWLQFPNKQPSTITSIISQYGFHWNNKRQAWQHPCGTLTDERPENPDPRKRYRSYFAADQKAA